MRPRINLPDKDAFKLDWDNNRSKLRIISTDRFGGVTTYPNISAVTVQLTCDVFYILRFVDEDFSSAKFEPTYRCVRKFRKMDDDNLFRLKLQIYNLLMNRDDNGFICMEPAGVTKPASDEHVNALSIRENWPVIGNECGYEYITVAKILA